MASTTGTSIVRQVGETAGVVWKVLLEHGPMSMARLVKAVGQPRDIVMQALGWLAREDKIQIDEAGRSRVVSLK